MFLLIPFTRRIITETLLEELKELSAYCSNLAAQIESETTDVRLVQVEQYVKYSKMTASMSIKLAQGLEQWSDKSVK